eukprot:1603254-Prymnesium_polylepis.1
MASRGPLRPRAGSTHVQYAARGTSHDATTHEARGLHMHDAAASCAPRGRKSAWSWRWTISMRFSSPLCSTPSRAAGGLPVCITANQQHQDAGGRIARPDPAQEPMKMEIPFSP